MILPPFHVDKKTRVLALGKVFTKLQIQHKVVIVEWGKGDNDCSISVRGLVVHHFEDREVLTVRDIGCRHQVEKLLALWRHTKKKSREDVVANNFITAEVFSRVFFNLFPHCKYRRLEGLVHEGEELR
jgi:hypothetical protein